MSGENRSRRQFLRETSAGLLAAPIVSSLQGCSRNITGSRPNLVFVFADQLRADALGYAGNEKATTPNLDRFASRSMRFTNAVSAMPVCAAFRASLLTGKYPSTHGTEFTSLALDFLDNAARSDEPFALFLSWNPPHDPWEQDNVTPDSWARFENVEFELPENFNPVPDPYMDRYPDFAFKSEAEWNPEYLATGLAEHVRRYYAMTYDLDLQFGRLMRKLEELGLNEDTVVVFTSDHGEMFGSHGRMWKLTFYDEAARVPFLVRLPGGTGHGLSDACLSTPDIMPTILGLLGLHDAVPEEVEGRDLSFVLRGEEGGEPEAAFLQGMGHTYRWIDGFEWRAVRDKRFTLARYLRDGKTLLFDRDADPLCVSDVSADPAYGVDLTRLLQFMDSRMAELNDGFHPCTWYRDNWMYKGYSIQAGARGPFGPLPPIEPLRT